MVHVHDRLVPASLELMDQSRDRAAAGLIAFPYEAQGLFHLGVVVDPRGLNRRMSEGGRGVVPAHQEREERGSRVSELVRRPMLNHFAFRASRFPQLLVHFFNGPHDVGVVAAFRVVFVVARVHPGHVGSHPFCSLVPGVLR